MEPDLNQDREEKIKLLTKLHEIHKKLEYLQHSASGYGYTYVPESKILGVLRPLMHEYKILLTSRMTSVRLVEVHKEVIKKDGTKIELNNTCAEVPFKFTWIDVETGYEMEEFICLQDEAGSPQKFGGMMTYAQRYFLLKFFNIPTDKDDPDVYKAKYNSSCISQQQVDEILTLIKSDKERIRKLCSWADVSEINDIDEKLYKDIIGHLLKEKSDAKS